MTVGTQLPFDRLVRAVDEWALAHGRDDVTAQIGPSTYKAHAVRCVPFVDPPEFDRLFSSADLIVAHAGMGTILSALESGRRLLVMPRRASLGEHRNEHQIATARRFAELGKVAVAMDEQELLARLDDYRALSGVKPISPFASAQLLSYVTEFIHGLSPANVDDLRIRSTTQRVPR